MEMKIIGFVIVLILCVIMIAPAFSGCIFGKKDRNSLQNNQIIKEEQNPEKQQKSICPKNKTEDFNGDGVVVIAIVDTGINMFHNDFRADYYNDEAVRKRTDDFTKHPSEYIEGFPKDAEAVNFNWSANSYDDFKAQHDEKNLESEKLYWIPGTKIIGAYGAGTATDFIDNRGHGTACASVAAGNKYGYCPDALIVAIKGGPIGLKWACSQPWIDLVSCSWSMGWIGDPIGLITIPQPFDSHLHNETKLAAERGQIVLFCAGNGYENGFITPKVGYIEETTGPDWHVVVGAVTFGSNQTLIATGKPVDISSYGTGDLKAADYDSITGTQIHSGTSCATPMTAGVFATALLAARNLLCDAHVGQYNESGQIIAKGNPALSGPLDDGKLTRSELKDVVFKTAMAPGAGLPFSLDDGVVVLPSGGTPLDWPLCGYGIANKESAKDAVAVINGSMPLPDRSDVDQWMAYDEQIRDYLWGDYDSGNGSVDKSPSLPEELSKIPIELMMSDFDIVFNAYLCSRQ
jgi:subtilisin family serine protease